jgi:hypothetical protein
MMTVERAIGAILAGDAGVLAVASDRIYNGEIPAGTEGPAVEIGISGELRPVDTLEGGCALTQCTIYTFSAAKGQPGTDNDLASDLDYAVIAALNDEIHGEIADGSPPEMLFVQLIENVRAHRYSYNETARMYGYVSEFRVWFLDPRKLGDDD